MVMGRRQLLVDSLRRLVRRGATPHLRRILEKTRAEDLSDAIAELAPREARAVFTMLLEQPDQGAEVVSAYDHSRLGQLFEGFEPAQLKPLFEYLSSDDAADILGELPDALSAAILEALEEEEKEGLEELMQYAEDTAGGIMSTDFFALDKELTAREAIVALQENPQAEMVFYVYCVNEEGTLVGVLSLRQLLTVPPATQIKEVMNSDVISVPVDMDQEEVAALVARYNLLAIPVIDGFNKLSGIITVDDVIDVLREEATEDMMRMAGVSEDVGTRSTTDSVKTRVPWLFGAMSGGLGAALMISFLGHRLASAVLLVGFIPVVAGVGGNVGVQSATIVVRGIAMGQLDPTRILATVWAELKVAAIVAVLMACTAGTGAFFIGEGVVPLAAAVASSIASVIFFAALVGTSVPLLFHRFGIDPAVATGPILTTSIDLIGIPILFTWATVWGLI